MPEIKDKLRKEFDELNIKSKIISKNQKLADDQKYMSKNRYASCLPYSLNMVTTDGKGFNGPNYFNGNYILGVNGEVEFIATQGPIPESFNDVWNIIIKNKVHTIVGKIFKYRNL